MGLESSDLTSEQFSNLIEHCSMLQENLMSDSAVFKDVISGKYRFNE
jgi:hypothetical protein